MESSHWSMQCNTAKATSLHMTPSDYPPHYYRINTLNAKTLIPSGLNWIKLYFVLKCNRFSAVSYKSMDDKPQYRTPTSAFVPTARVRTSSDYFTTFSTSSSPSSSSSLSFSVNSTTNQHLIWYSRLQKKIIL